jgi:hypothetical protein
MRLEAHFVPDENTLGPTSILSGLESGTIAPRPEPNQTKLSLLISLPDTNLDHNLHCLAFYSWAEEERLVEGLLLEPTKKESERLTDFPVTCRSRSMENSSGLANTVSEVMNFMVLGNKIISGVPSGLVSITAMTRARLNLRLPTAHTAHPLLRQLPSPDGLIVSSSYRLSCYIVFVNFK